MDKKKLSEDFNISLTTFYNWEKNKPKLIKIIKDYIEIEEIQNKEKEKQKKEKIKIKKKLNKIKKSIKKIEDLIKK